GALRIQENTGGLKHLRLHGFSEIRKSSSVCSADTEFLHSLNESFNCHPHYEGCEPPEPPCSASAVSPTSPHKHDNPVPANSFRVKHFAGSVTYSVSGFLAKNTDSLDISISRCLFTFNHPLIKILFPEGNSKRGSRRPPATVGTQFKISLGALLNNLGSKNPHFVRCIKPNESKTPRVFDPSLVQHQVRYLGILEFTRLRSAGFVVRETYTRFLDRYKMLSTHTWPSWQGAPVEGVTCLLRELPVSGSEYVLGRTRICIRSIKCVDELENWRKERVDELVTLIQKVWRGFIARRNWKRLRESQIVISSYWKRWKDKSHVTELKQRRQQEWAVEIIQKHYRVWQRKRWLVYLAHSLPSESPISREWPRAPHSLRETSFLLRKLYHRWRCERFRERFDQTSRNRMREKVTASLIFKEKKSSYPRSVSVRFMGDYVGLRRNPQWKDVLTKNSLHKMDRYVVFADIVNKINRSNGKFVPILFVISTSSMLILDQRTMQIKYRVPAGEIFKLSLSPFFDDIAVFHVRASSPTRELRSQANIPSCLSSEAVKRKGDFVFQTGHVIEIVTKLFLVVQNCTGKPPAVNISTEFEANFGTHNVTFQFKV
ncbi:unconventional myosin-Ib, partial [Eurytemora carolleeae]|uniref:unconventional myosin-Ib n=1 Tax=Eurytemora carolleeae TaxID=1294199 RepID=UPI000C76FF87